MYMHPWIGLQPDFWRPLLPSQCDIWILLPWDIYAQARNYSTKQTPSVQLGPRLGFCCYHKKLWLQKKHELLLWSAIDNLISGQQGSPYMTQVLTLLYKINNNVMQECTQQQGNMSLTCIHKYFSGVSIGASCSYYNWLKAPLVITNTLRDSIIRTIRIHNLRQPNNLYAHGYNHVIDFRTRIKYTIPSLPSLQSYSIMEWPS